jgi:hypothetical protein
MSTTTNYPNGQSLVSSALTIQQINIIIQTLTCGMLGINPPDPAQVRVDWQAQGQPDVALPSQDSCYISCVPENVDYRLVRDRILTGTGPVTENWNYTRGWTISWDTYGPNSTDRARQIYSALFMDYFNDEFSLSNLYPVLNPPEPVRIPVMHNAQWYDHTHFHCTFYEAVTETIEDAIVTSVEVKIYDGSPDDPAADITINR